MASKIFYQSPLPRSGSALLLAILRQNPAFDAAQVSGLFELVAGTRISFSTNPEFKAQDADEMKKALLSFLKAGIHSYCATLGEKPYVVDTSALWAGHFDLMSSILGEEPKIVCLIRDLRQILSVMEKQFRANPDKMRPIENHNKLAGTTTFKRAMIHLQTSPLGPALDRLVEINQRNWSKKILFLRFEDLTEQPQQSLDRIYAYFGVPPHRHDFNDLSPKNGEADRRISAPGSGSMRPKVEPVQKDFLEILGPEVIRHIQSQYGWYFQLFGYHPASV